MQHLEPSDPYRQYIIGTDPAYEHVRQYTVECSGTIGSSDTAGLPGPTDSFENGPPFGPLKSSHSDLPPFPLHITR